MKYKIINIKEFDRNYSIHVMVKKNYITERVFYIPIVDMPMTSFQELLMINDIIFVYGEVFIFRGYDICEKKYLDPVCECKGKFIVEDAFDKRRLRCLGSGNLSNILTTVTAIFRNIVVDYFNEDDFRI